MVSIKPDQPVMKKSHAHSEGIEPHLQPYYMNAFRPGDIIGATRSKTFLERYARPEDALEQNNIVRRISDKCGNPVPGMIDLPPEPPSPGINPILIGHTSNPEFEKLRQDPMMEALRDRTVCVDVPYLLDWTKEARVLEALKDLETATSIATFALSEEEDPKPIIVHDKK